MYKIRLLILLLASLAFVSCSTDNRTSKIQLSVAYISGEYDGLLLSNKLKGFLNNFGMLNNSSNYEVRGTISHSNNLFITNIDNTSDRERVESSVEIKVYDKVKFCNKLLGYRASPDDAYLVLRGLRTLDIRLKKHEENTKKIVNFLKKEKKIKEVLYPHKKDSENYKNWKKYYSGSTGLFSIVIKSKNRNSIYNFINSLKLFGIGQSWGGFESLVLYQTHVIQRVYKKHITPNHHIVRFHIGLEDPKDLIEDLRKAIKKIK